MSRCDPWRRLWLRRCACTLLPASALSLLAPAGWAQETVARRFPAHALRGTLTFTSPPDVTLEGLSVRLAPGARIRDTRNLLVVMGALAGQTLVTHYTVGLDGLLHEVWILRPDELARFWPRSAKQAAQYTFDPAAQTWSKN